MDTSQNNLSSNVTTRTAVAAVVGDTASALGGGSFANGAYTAAFQHLFNQERGAAIKKVIDRMQRIYKSCQTDCVTTARDAYRKFYGDNSISAGEDGTYKELMIDMRAKGYATQFDKFSYNGNLGTEIRNATYMTRDIAGSIHAGGPGIYSIGIANGYHVMTLTYDGKTGVLMDQFNPFFTTSNGDHFKAEMDRWTFKMRDSFAKPTESAIMYVNKLKIP